MSDPCDPRNRPGFAAGDLRAFVPEPPSVTEPSDELHTVLLAAFSAALIVATVFGMVLYTV